MNNKLIVAAILIPLISGPALVSQVVAQDATNQTSTQTQETQNWLDKINVQIDLAQARVEVLRARVALEIDNSQEKAVQALDNAEERLKQARDSASEYTALQIDLLEQEVRDARDAIYDAPGQSVEKLNDLANNIGERAREYGDIVAETEEAKLLKLRYAQLQAQVAILNAQLAEKVDETGEQAMSYLDQATQWYDNAKSGASDKWQETLTAVSDQIDAVNQTISDTRNKAADAITDLAARAADIVGDDEAETSE